MIIYRILLMGNYVQTVTPCLVMLRLFYCNDYVICFDDVRYARTTSRERDPGCSYAMLCYYAMLLCYYATMLCYYGVQAIRGVFR